VNSVVILGCSALTATNTTNTTINVGTTLKARFLWHPRVSALTVTTNTTINAGTTLKARFLWHHLQEFRAAGKATQARPAQKGEAEIKSDFQHAWPANTGGYDRKPRTTVDAGNVLELLRKIAGV
jgi:hypothetical protein